MEADLKIEPLDLELGDVKLRCWRATDELNDSCQTDQITVNNFFILKMKLAMIRRQYYELFDQLQQLDLIT